VFSVQARCRACSMLPGRRVSPVTSCGFPSNQYLPGYDRQDSARRSRAGTKSRSVQLRVGMFAKSALLEQSATKRLVVAGL